MASAAILLGGRASRLGGRDKAAIVVSGQTILERQIGQLRGLTDDILLIGAPFGHSSHDLRAVHDRVPDSGPLGGLDAALAAARDDRLVLLACDMPFVSAPFLAHLLTLSQNADAVVPRTERGYHPLCAVYTRACQTRIVRRLAERRLKMLEFLGDINVHVVERDEIDRFGDGERLLTNVNTPNELHNLEALLSHEL